MAVTSLKCYREQTRNTMYRTLLQGPQEGGTVNIRLSEHTRELVLVYTQHSKLYFVSIQ